MTDERAPQGEQPEAREEFRENWARELDQFIAYVDGCDGLRDGQKVAISNTVSLMLARLVDDAGRWRARVTPPDSPVPAPSGERAEPTFKMPGDAKPRMPGWSSGTPGNP